MGSEVRDHVMQALGAAWPICLGYLAIGIAFGVLAAQAGLSLLQIALMSVIVFAGSSQFIAVSMISSGAGILAVILTTFMVNLRHLLMSSSLALHLKGTNRSILSLFAYGVTDESFAVNLTRFTRGEWDVRRSLIVNHTANSFWVVSTVLGGYIGELVPPGAFGIDYALTSMFLCLLVFQLSTRITVVVSLSAGILAVIFSLLLPGNFHVIVASVIAASLGVFAKRSLEKSPPEGEA
ncbi:MAG: AzlC family ABC transporter permease [Desulfomonilia bacterium]